MNSTEWKKTAGQLIKEDYNGLADDIVANNSENKHLVLKVILNNITKKKSENYTI